MAFFYYRQNNSGGRFDFDADAGISAHVIVEADSADEANERAEGIGLYFDGSGDCRCCGNRWYPQSGDEDGDAVPSIYGTPLENASTIFHWLKGRPDVFVHYESGAVAAVTLPVRQ